jgi:hypothetical protein
MISAPALLLSMFIMLIIVAPLTIALYTVSQRIRRIDVVIGTIIALAGALIASGTTLYWCGIEGGRYNCWTLLGYTAYSWRPLAEAVPPLTLVGAVPAVLGVGLLRFLDEMRYDLMEEF